MCRQQLLASFLASVLCLSPPYALRLPRTQARSPGAYLCVGSARPAAAGHAFPSNVRRALALTSRQVPVRTRFAAVPCAGPPGLAAPRGLWKQGALGIGTNLCFNRLDAAANSGSRRWGKKGVFVRTQLCPGQATRFGLDTRGPSAAKTRKRVLPDPFF